MPSNMMQNQFWISKLVHKKNSRFAFIIFRVVRKTNTKTETGFFPRNEVKIHRRKINDIITRRFLAVSAMFRCFCSFENVKSMQIGCSRILTLLSVGRVSRLSVLMKLLAAACHVVQINAKSPSVVISIIQKHVQNIKRRKTGSWVTDDRQKWPACDFNFHYSDH